MGNPALDELITVILLLGGAGLLTYCIFPAFRIISRFTAGSYRSHWLLLVCFIIFFALSYFLFAIYLLNIDVEKFHLMMAGIFFLFAIFILLVCNLVVNMTGAFAEVERLQRESITDGLMGVYNRRYFDQRLHEEFEKARRYELMFSLILVDIDNFKEINDSFGHRVGDKFLLEFSRILNNNTRPGDIVARYGGEELGIILPNTNLEDAGTVARKLLENTARDKFELSDTGKFSSIMLKVTVSAGVAGYSTVLRGPSEIISRADEALYRAKNRGRNCVVIYGE